MATIRAFIALPIPEEIQNALGELQGRLKKALNQVRWTKPKNIHLTLKFLGEVEDYNVVPIEKALAEVATLYESFPVVADGLDCFPLKGSPRVIWLGLKEETGTLANLAASIEKAMEELSFPKENRAFAPHLTLGRLRQGQKPKISPQTIREMIQKEESTQLGTFEAQEVLLIKSNLTPNGPIYSNLATLKLGTSP